MSGTDSCRFVEEYLDQFKTRGAKLDHEAISRHVGTCSTCYDRMAGFFRVMQVPEGAYLDETVDDLTLSLYNLAKALMKAPAAGDGSKSHENVLFVHQPDEPSRYVDEGREIAADVQDYIGRDEYRGASMRDLSDMMQRSRQDFGMVFMLLDKAIAFDRPYSQDCRNLKGILRCQEGRLDEAEQLFRQVIGSGSPDAYLRSVQVHAMNNLSFICRTKGDLDQAIKWAVKSKVLAEETDLDTFASLFGLMYFHLVRGKAGDLEAAAESIAAILRSETGRGKLLSALMQPQNHEVRAFVEKHDLHSRFGLVVS